MYLMSVDVTSRPSAVDVAFRLALVFCPWSFQNSSRHKPPTDTDG